MTSPKRKGHLLQLTVDSTFDDVREWLAGFLPTGPEHEQVRAGGCQMRGA